MVSIAATGLNWSGRGQRAMPVVSGRLAGNQLPGYTGAPDRPFRPGPSGRNGVVGGQLGGVGDGNIGSDPRAAKMQPWPRRNLGGIGPAQMDVPNSGARQSFWRGGIQGFNDKLTTKDRHAYWDTGHQRSGIRGPAWGFPNTYNNPAEQPPAPELRTVNRTVSYQKGSDKTRNQDDLSRPYTWLGEQGARWTPVNGGVPGLYQPYGTRGGVPYAIVSPVGQGQPGDGPHVVSDGPPHGLHTQTPWKGGAQIIRRFASTPQTRPVRIDRPSNSPQAGQSYSQTVLPQGASRVRPSSAPAGRGGHGPAQHVGRGWQGRSG